MNSNRLINIILSQLSTDNLKLEEDLERTINGTDDANSKVFKVKHALKELVINELMISKFQNLISNTNNNNLNQNQNG